jgi:serine/threonine-protein kinase
VSTQNQGTPDLAAVTSAGRPGLSVGTLVGDRYEIVRLLGEGGMGSVYEARHKILGRHVAIKVLKPEVALNEGLVARFLQEAKAAAELHHKNIVELTDYGVDGDRPYMVMELLHGEDLAHLLRREGKLPVPRLVALIDPVLRGLAMAHERGVIHRDIKPENIFLVADDEGEPTPKIVDFGIAKRQEESVQLTSANMALGTPAYMAPEQIMSSRTVTGAADQYAVGVTLYEALTGRNPYDADTLNAFIVAKATQDPEPLAGLRPDLDPRFIAIVMKTLSRKPDDRYPTIAALREALAPFRNATPGAAPSPMDVSSQSLPRPAVATGASSHAYDATLTPANLSVPIIAAPPAAARSPLPMVLGAAGLALALGIGGYVAFGARASSNTPPVTERPATPPPPQPGQQEVLFSIEVEPRTAQIRLDGDVIGTGRAEVVRPKDGRHHQLQVDAPGFATVSEVLTANADVRLTRQLAPTAAPPPNNPPPRHGTPAARVETPTPRVEAPPTPRVETPPTPRVETPPTPRVETPPATPRVDTAPVRPARPPRDPAHPAVDESNPFDESH